MITTLRRAGTGAIAGLLAVAVALGVALVVSGLVGPATDPVVAVGSAAINLTPVPVKDFAIQHFGSHDKDVLVIGILVVLAALAIVTGLLGLRRIWYGLAGLAGFAAVGIAAAVTRPAAGPLAAAPVLAGSAAAAVALVLLTRLAPGGQPRPEAAAPGERAAAPGERAAGGATRRRFLAASAATLAVAAAGGAAGRALLDRFNVAALRAAVRLPPAARSAPPTPAGAQLPVPGITPFITSNENFYRVDTEIVLPQVSPETWTLRIHGLVDRPLELSFDDLLRQPLTETEMTLVCVSNQVGGSLAGNARWLGASLRDLLRRAGVHSEANQILSTSTDGWTCGTPLDAVMSDPEALLAVGMNGQPLPVEHGFPARMLVPGLYGYVSATKWVTDIELTTFAAQKAYWVQRGYSAQAPVKTMSRIDVPKPLAHIAAGRVAVAGVAWAPHRGIETVSVRVDTGPWQQARLAAVPNADTWRQWVWTWDARPGLHQIEVRAVDGTGEVQTARQAPVFPNGASGWDSTTVTVS